MPAVFIPLAEDIGVIHRLGRWVMTEACRQLRLWPEPVRVSVNISPVELREPHFAASTIRIAAECGVAPQRVTLEITETAVLDNGEATRNCLMALREAGFGLALDDFGTGYSSLKSPQVVPIDKIKIDQAFVGQFGVNEASTSIVQAIVALAHSLGLRTTAEGIETPDQARRLSAEGCDEGQGFYFSRPMSAAAAHAFSLTHKAHVPLPRAANG
jgi:EAL domain-containing protein (putative c-di-GMP-specific phosphodiesterase class I)